MPRAAFQVLRTFACYESQSRKDVTRAKQSGMTGLVLLFVNEYREIIIGAKFWGAGEDVVPPIG